MPRILDGYSVWERLKRAGYQKLFSFQDKAINAFIKKRCASDSPNRGSEDTHSLFLCYACSWDETAVHVFGAD